jgi:hypothetical protein
MTEAEWLACAALDRMLAAVRPEASDRKLRLFACACARRAWQRLWQRPAREAVEAAERLADGLLAEADLAPVRQASAAHYDQATHADAAAAWLGRWITAPEAIDAAAAAASAARAVLAPAGTQHRRAEQVAEQQAQCRLLRDVFGPLPFRPVAIDPKWLTWNHGTVPAIARRIYEERAFHDMPILADALEDAGCTEADLLAHCRAGGPHVRGCWAVDLLLGKA